MTTNQELIDTNQDAALGYLDKKPGLNPAKAILKRGNSIPKYHWARDKVDTRDYLYLPSGNKIAATSRVDLRQYCTAIEDQGSLGSCTGNAIAGAIELLNNRNGRYQDISRLFIYYYERLMLGTINYDSGAYIRDGIKVAYNYGAAVEALWPYQISKFKTRPTQPAILDGQKRKITLYERVTNLAGCIDAISQGYPVIVGFNVYSSFNNLGVRNTGMMPYPNVAKEKLLGGHAVLLVGYDAVAKRFTARNSWGARWGDKGYFYMPYQVIENTSMSGDFWIIKSVNNP